MIQNIYDFFFNYYISSYFIGLYRICAVSVLVIYLLNINKHAINFSKHSGIYPYTDFISFCNSHRSKFNIFYYCSYQYLNYIIIYLFYIFGFLSIFGLFTNFSLLIFIICVQSLQHRIAPIISSGGDVIANVILWSLFFIDSGAALSLDSVIFQKNIEYVEAWSFRLIQITISFGFLSAGILKFLSPSWKSGLALRNAILFTTWSKNNFRTFFEKKIIYLSSNYIVIIYQLLSPILFWIPNLTIFAIIFGSFLHFMMILTLRIGYFGPITIMAVLSFVANYFQR